MIKKLIRGEGHIRELMRTLSKTSRLLGAHKNASNQAAIGFSQESDWLRK